MDARAEPPAEPGALDSGPLPNRFTRATMVGCAGIVLVMGLPALLLLPLAGWGAPGWLTLLAPLLAFMGAALGAWLLGRVPSGSRARSHDPAHPLTHSGTPPLREWPATRGNRAALGVTWALVAVAAGGYVVASVGYARPDGLLRGALLTGSAGLALLAQGLLVASRRVPLPALRWVRVPIQVRLAYQGGPLMLAGLAALGWGLWVVAGAGYVWGFCGLVALVLGAVLVAPFARREPAGRSAAPSLSGRPHPGWRTPDSDEA